MGQNDEKSFEVAATVITAIVGIASLGFLISKAAGPSESRAEESDDIKIMGLAPQLEKKLRRQGINTLGELKSFLQRTRPQDVSGIGAVRAKELEGAAVRHGIEDVEQRALEESGLDARTRNALSRRGVRTLEDLQKFGQETDFRVVKGLGRDSVDRLEAFFRARGWPYKR